MNADFTGKRYLALDSGGTKVAAILYDGNFNTLATARSGSLRGNSTDPELVEQHFQDLISQLGLKKGDRIERVCGAFGQQTAENLKKIFDIELFLVNGEMNIGLAAAGILGDGILALSGTGATVFCREKGKKYVAGGFGSAVADEGSGYWIGRQAMLAAIRGMENRGPATSLTRILPGYFKEKAALTCDVSTSDGFRAAVFSIYADKCHSPVAQIASVVPLVVKAAEDGDGEARGILEEAGKLLAEQTLYLIRSNDIGPAVPIAISGSVWKKNKLYLNAFVNKMAESEPSRILFVPTVEPVVGAIVKHMNLNGRYKEFRDKLADKYPDFAYSI